MCKIPLKSVIFVLKWLISKLIDYVNQLIIIVLK